MSELIPRDYINGDEEEIVHLLEDVFKGWPKFDLTVSPVEHWRWKYQERFLDKKYLAITESEGKIIGVDHTQPNLVKINDTYHICSQGGDAAVHPYHRGKGIHRTQLKWTKEIRQNAGIIFGIAITGNPIVIGMFERSELHKRFPIPLTHYVRINDFQKHLKYNPKEDSWINKIGFHTLNIVNKILKEKKQEPYKDLHVEAVKKFDDDFDQFWEKIKQNYDLIIVHDSQYMNWRYLDPRAGPFIVKHATENGKIVGMIVSRINKINPDYPVGFIADLLVENDRPDVADALIQDAIQLFDQEEVNIINYLAVRNYQHDNLLKKHGFIDSHRDHHIYYRKLSEIDYLENVKEAPHNRIHFYFGQLDLI